MTLSLEDMKSAFSGASILIGLLLVANLLMGFIDHFGGVASLPFFTDKVLFLGAYLVSFLLLAFIVSLIAVGISAVLKLIFRL